MFPNQHGNGVVLSPEEVQTFNLAFETTRFGMNYENLPDCLAPKQLHLPESQEDGNTVVDDHLLKIARYSAELAIKVTARNLTSLKGEYATYLDSDDEDQQSMLGILAAEMSYNAANQIKFQTFYKSTAELSSRV